MIVSSFVLRLILWIAFIDYSTGARGELPEQEYGDLLDSASDITFIFGFRFDFSSLLVHTFPPLTFHENTN